MAQVSSPATGGKEPKSQASPPMLGSKRGPKAFLNDVARELKKVDWPTVKETHRLTAIVLTVCGVIIVVLTVLSYLFEILTNLITKGSI
jgi:preprotein translocase SecE subunit